MKKLLLCGIIILLLLATVVMSFGIIIPVYFSQADIAISGPLVMEQQTDGKWLLSWPASEAADRYQIELFAPVDGQEDQLLYRDFTNGETSILLTTLPDDMDLSVQITPAVKFKTLLGEDYRYGEKPLHVTAHFVDMPLAVENAAFDGDEKTLKLDVQNQDNPHWQYQLLDHTGNILEERILSEASLMMQFGEDSGIALPKAGEDYHLRIRPFREEADLQIYGRPSEELRITEENLRFRTLDPKLEMVSKNTFQITWEQTRGLQYEVQVLTPETESWNTVHTIAQGQMRSYQDLLEPGQTKQYRIAASDGQGEYLTVSEPLTAMGRERVQYATVWPVRDLPAYRQASVAEMVNTVKAGTAYCVLEEANGMFAVRIDDQICYIQSNYCMINLPDYVGGLCNYNITNSYHSIYAIHEFAIENVTGVVTAGYENILQEDGSYLVPLLYPAAKRLLNAAKAAWEQGYRLKIYDSFRPYIATREIYDLTSLIMDDPVPDFTYTGKPKEEMELPSPRPGWDYLSLGWLMTGTNYLQNSFLAQNGSSHNRGIALDLTLEDRETGKEIPMQSSMHDLSQYSVLGSNNEAANLLGNIMHKAGFSGLVSEWWHFQDNHASASLGLPYVAEGVDAQCWVKDDLGWKYRGAKGTFYSGQTIEIFEKEYTFDENGYVIE